MDICQLFPVSQAIQPAKVSFVVDVPETEIHLLANDLILKLLFCGRDLFDLPFVMGEPGSSRDNTNTAFWYFETQNDKIESIRKILSHAKEIFAKEERVIEVS